MKKTFKALALGICAALVLTATTASVFAQNDVCSNFEANQALYAKYTDNYKGPITESTLAQRKVAADAAKEYVAKYAACEDFSAQVDYLKKAGPSLQKKIDAFEKEMVVTKRYNRFDEAMKAKNTAEIFASGAEILKYEPDFLDVTIVLASVGLDEAAKETDTYNNKTLEYANAAVDMLNKNEKSESGKFGAYQYEYDTKENALGWMNYAIGLVKYYRQKKEDEGLTYFYKATQYDSETKEKAFIYELMGKKYQAQAVKLKDEIIALLKSNDMKESFESKMKDALLRGYIDRAIDAYAKAFQLTKEAEAKNAIYENMKGLYRFRYETPDKTFTDEELKTRLDTYVASIKNKPIPSPTSEVQPVNPPDPEEEKTEEATDASATSAIDKPAKKPAPKTNGNKP